MSVTLVGRKIGMTQMYTEEGAAIPVTVIEVEPNRVTKIENNNDYCSVQVTTGQMKVNKISKALAGHYKKAGVEPGRKLWEFVLSQEAANELKPGDTFDLASFKEGQKVDVSGLTKGKGFAGAVKRHGFKTQDATHGNSLSHRAPGSIGQNQTPGRVFKGKKMAGHMGARKQTVQNLEIVRIVQDKNLLLVKGAIPGAVGGNVSVRSAVKSNQEASA